VSFVGMDVFLMCFSLHDRGSFEDITTKWNDRTDKVKNIMHLPRPTPMSPLHYVPDGTPLILVAWKRTWTAKWPQKKVRKRRGGYTRSGTWNAPPKLWRAWNKSSMKQSGRHWLPNLPKRANGTKGARRERREGKVVASCIEIASILYSNVKTCEERQWIMSHLPILIVTTLLLSIFTSTLLLLSSTTMATPFFFWRKWSISQKLYPFT